MSFKYKNLYYFLAENDGIFDAPNKDIFSIELKTEKFYKNIDQQITKHNLEQLSAHQLSSDKLVEKILLKSLLEIIEFPYPDIYSECYAKNFKTMHRRLVARLIEDTPLRYPLIKAYLKDKSTNS